jgi:hypothetical protein
MAVCLGGFSAAGCRTAGNSPGSRFAWVVIRGNTPGQIENVTREVFVENGYLSATSRSNTMVFERKGSALDEVAYGGLINQAVWVKVTADVVPVGEAAFRLECNAYRVEDKGTPTEEETRLWRSHPYQKLLDQVATRLKNKPGPLP